MTLSRVEPLGDPIVLLLQPTAVLRERHRRLLADAGYTVNVVGVSPESDELRDATIVMVDHQLFYWLQDRIPPSTPVIVVASEVQAGATACLCGAAAWVPTNTQDGYLLDTLNEVMRRFSRSTQPRDEA
jgi:hypothetical protein